MRQFLSSCFLLLVIAMACAGGLSASLSWARDESQIAWSGLADTYVAYYSNRPSTQVYPYTTQALYDGEPRINLAMFDVKASGADFRSHIAVQEGDSVQANYASEADLFWRYIQEASAGVRFSERLWFDGGIYPVHVGFESFSSRDNWNYTRSLVAEFSPYYETGARLTAQISDTLTAAAHVVRGWQNISSAAEPMYGVQLAYAPDDANQVSYAGLAGSQFGGYRTFHDFIVRRDFTSRWSMAGQLDLGTQGREDQSRGVWHGMALLSRYRVSSDWSVGARIERYDDPQQIIVPTLSGKAYRVTALSLNVDRNLGAGFTWRTEGRIFIGTEPIFPENRKGQFSADEALLVTSLSYSFSSIQDVAE